MDCSFRRSYTKYLKARSVLFLISPDERKLYPWAINKRNLNDLYRLEHYVKISLHYQRAV